MNVYKRLKFSASFAGMTKTSEQITIRPPRDKITYNYNLYQNQGANNAIGNISVNTTVVAKISANKFRHNHKFAVTVTGVSATVSGSGIWDGTSNNLNILPLERGVMTVQFRDVSNNHVIGTRNYNIT